MCKPLLEISINIENNIAARKAKLAELESRQEGDMNIASNIAKILATIKAKLDELGSDKEADAPVIIYNKSKVG